LNRGARWLGRGIGFLSLILAALLLIPFSPSMPGVDLDESWKYALNEAVADGRVFGRDVIFTFGPLGSVLTRTFHPATDTIMMLASTLYAAGFCIAFALLAHPRRHALAIFLPFAVWLLREEAAFLALPFVLLLAVLRLTSPPGSSMHLRASLLTLSGIAISTSAVAIEPLIKGNLTGVVLPLGVLAFILLLRWDWRAGLGFAAVALASLVAAWVMVGQPLAQLPRFFVTQGPVISGYTTGMALEGSRRVALVYLVASLALAAFFYVQFVRRAGWREWFTLAGLVWLLFVAFKAGFVRQDLHAFTAAGALLFAAYAVCLLSSPKSALAALGAAIGAWAYISIAAWVAAAGPLSASIPTFTLQQVPSLILGQVAYRWNTAVSALATRLENPRQLDSDFAAAKAVMRTQVPLPPVTGTVDIYPWQLSAIFANGLRWSGRPVFQSYSVYEPSLDAMNVAHLRGPDAPDTVFLAFYPIDGRLPALDDAGSLLQLLTAYDVVGYQAPYVQLAKRAPQAALPLDVAATRIVSAKLGADIAIGDRGPVWARVSLRPTLLGRLIAAAYKLPPLHIVLKLDDGRIVDRRYIAAIGNAGFILSPYLSSPEDFILMASGGGGAPEVKSFHITTAGEGLWSRQFEVQLTPFHLAARPQLRALFLAQSVVPPATLSHPFNGLNPACHIDLVNGQRPTAGSLLHGARERLSLQGWTNPPGGADETWISLTSSATGEKRFFRAAQQARPDVTSYFGLPATTRPGFNVILDLKAVRGSQTLDIYALSGSNAYACGLGLRLE
jgi:hypothetical protein